MVLCSSYGALKLPLKILLSVFDATVSKNSTSRLKLFAHCFKLTLLMPSFSGECMTKILDHIYSFYQQITL
jgi:hypothetical protein